MHLPLDTFDTVRILPEHPSFVELPAAVEPQIVEDWPEDASAELWRGKSTCGTSDNCLNHASRTYSHEIAEQDLGVQRTTGISKFDMSHPVNGSLFKN